MEISAKNQIKGKVTSVIHGTSYSQVAVEQTDADGNTTGSFIHAAIPVDICKKWSSIREILLPVFSLLLQLYWQNINF